MYERLKFPVLGDEARILDEVAPGIRRSPQDIDQPLWRWLALPAARVLRSSQWFPAWKGTRSRKDCRRGGEADAYGDSWHRASCFAFNP